ncbi:MAG: invasion associated locus B family protein [Sulfitobacter sp.]
MLKYFATLSIAALMGTTAATALVAQTATTTEAPAATTEAPAAPAATDAVEEKLEFGEDASGEPQIGQPYTRENFDEWELRCIKGEEGAEADEPCQMYQLLDDGEGVPVAEVSLFRLPGSGKAEAGATIVVPLETSLPQQLNIAVDGGKPRRYPYAFCNPVGCYARLGLTPADVTAFKNGAKATITIVPALAPDQKVLLNLSLKGFTAAYGKTSVIEQ